MSSCGNESCIRPADKKCSICSEVYYCSSECQHANWPQHKVSCKVSVVRLRPSGGAYWDKNIPQVPHRERFVEEKLERTHAIFKKGELCPLTEFYGHPILIYCPLIHSKVTDRPMGDNELAVYLRIEPSDGFAPPKWQVHNPGDCFVVRRDKKPLSKDLVQTMFAYHSDLLDWYFEEQMESGHPPGQGIDAADFKRFYKKYWHLGEDSDAEPV
ncbi:hypothetical protein CPB83DRAFT_862750 [Crepidotus variabilis]|uniref:MYND-type domain-containing protein n=1 Tax=Crepidotus variabilis TaxID=179855 RepID=A0A9P6JJZ7_9AGAR|nr:hypothetical protein CPB83DRAFT_862750 [Crepidotus variabilis]